MDYPSFQINDQIIFKYFLELCDFLKTVFSQEHFVQQSLPFSNHQWFIQAFLSFIKFCCKGCPYVWCGLSRSEKFIWKINIFQIHVSHWLSEMDSSTFPLVPAPFSRPHIIGGFPWAWQRRLEKDLDRWILSYPSEVYHTLHSLAQHEVFLAGVKNILTFFSNVVRKHLI